MLIRLILKLYLYMVISVVFHEFFHIIAGLICFGKIDKIVIGSEKFCLKIGTVSISPIIFNGRVEVDYEILARSNRIRKICFFLSGIMANILIIVFLLLEIKMNGGNILNKFAIGLNITYIVYNIFPMEDNDMGTLMQVIRS